MYVSKCKRIYISIMKEEKKIATTVKINSELYDELKVLSVRHKFTLQSLVEKCVYFYVRKENFRNTLNGLQVPVLSYTGSL